MKIDLTRQELMDLSYFLADINKSPRALNVYLGNMEQAKRLHETLERLRDAVEDSLPDAFQFPQQLDDVVRQTEGAAYGFRYLKE